LHPLSPPDRPERGPRLARSTGATLEREAGGLSETIDFAAALGLARSEQDGGSQRGMSATTPSPADVAAHAGTAGEPEKQHAASPNLVGGAADDEAVYEQLVERLRRELLVERERMGDLLGDLP
jgi:hypothetical protein